MLAPVSRRRHWGTRRAGNDARCGAAHDLDDYAEKNAPQTAWIGHPDSAQNGCRRASLDYNET